MHPRTWVRYLIVAEITEMFMREQGLGWSPLVSSEGSAGDRFTFPLDAAVELDRDTVIDTVDNKHTAQDRRITLMKSERLPKPRRGWRSA